MKKSSFFIAVSVMTLALVVAVVGITAAWFGDTYDYRDKTIRRQIPICLNNYYYS